MGIYQWTVALCLSAFILSTASVPAWAQSPANAQLAQVQQEETVNINTADADAIARALTGIGLKRAQDIVSYREQHGPFKNLEELGAIKGIGPAILEKNRTRIRL